MTTQFSTEISTLLPPAPAPRSPVERLSIKRMIRMRGPLMAAVAIGLAVVLCPLAWLFVKPEFTAIAQIPISSTRAGVLDEGKVIPGTEYDRYLKTMVQRIKGSGILQRVADDKTVYELPWVRREEDRLHFLMREVQADIERGSEYINITCTSPSREAAIKIVQKTVDVFIADVTNQESRGTVENRRLLSERRDKLEKAIEAQRGIILDKRKEAGVTAENATPPAEFELEFEHERLTQAIQELTEAENAVAEQNSILDRLASLQASNNGRAIHEMGVETRVLADAAVEMLRSREVLAAERLGDLENKYLPGMEPLEAEQESLAAVQKQLQEAKNKARTDALLTLEKEHRIELADAEERVISRKARVAESKEKIRDHERKLEALGLEMAKIKDEETKLEKMQGDLDVVTGRIESLDVEKEAPGRVGQPSETTAPTKPHSMKRLQWVLLALMASCGIALGLGLVQELSDNSILSPQDLAQVTDLQILAAIPHTSVDKLPEGTDAAMVTAEHPGTTSADEFRRIITRIIYPPEGSAELNTVMIAGPSRGDGKTSVACNLAISLAQANRRVLLTDISARRPKIEKRFGLPRGAGLNEILSGECSPDDVIRMGPFPNLYILGPGGDGEEVIGRFASRDIVEFLEKAEESFEHVVIDTPPSLLMSDAKLLAPVVDGVIVVVGVGVSSTGMVRRCVGEMRQVGASMVGVALNGVKPTRGGYMSENLRKFYAYGKDEETGAQSHEGGNSPHVVPPGRRTNGTSDGPANILLVDDHFERDDDSPDREA